MASIKKLLTFTLCFSSVLSLFAWIISRHDIPASESTRTWALQMPSVAKAGFPVQALELPQTPLGDDHIPQDMVGGVLLNELFWSVCGLLIAAIVVRTQKEKINEYQTAALALGVIAFLGHSVLFALWFD